MGNAGPLFDAAGEFAILLDDDGMDWNFRVSGSKADNLPLSGPTDVAGAAVFEEHSQFLLGDGIEIDFWRELRSGLAFS